MQSQLASEILGLASFGRWSRSIEVLENIQDIAMNLCSGSFLVLSTGNEFDGFLILFRDTKDFKV